MNKSLVLIWGLTSLAFLGLLPSPAHAANGELEWVGALGSTTTNDGVEDMALDSSGNVLIAGYILGDVDLDPGPGTATLTSAGNQDIFVLKLDPDGNYLWAHGFGSTETDLGTSVAVDSSGNVYVTGYFRGTVDFDPGAGVQNLVSAGGEDIFVLKLDSVGDFVWARRIGGLGRELSYGIAVDDTANVYTTGSYGGTIDFDPGAGTANLTAAGGIDVFLCKLDSTGDFAWARSMGGGSNDEGYDLAVDSDGYIYLTGTFAGTADFDPGAGTSNLTSNGNDDVFIEKVDSSGDFVWARSVGGTARDQGTDIAVDLDGNVLTVGPFSSPTIDLDPGAGVTSFTNAGLSDAFFQKLDADGDFVWANAIGSTGNDLASSIAVDASGAVYSTGRFSGTIDFDPGAGVLELTANVLDYYVQKYDAAGGLDWVRSMGGSGVDEGKCIAVDSAGAVYAAGDFSSTVDFDPGINTTELTSAGGRDLFVQKLVPDLIGPTVTSITPDVSNPTNADVINFTVVFSEGVTNFDDESDLTIVHSGTAHSSVTITGGPSTYTVEMDGISGNGSIDLAVNTGSDVTDFVPLALLSSVSTSVSIDNTPPTFSSLAVTPDQGAEGALVELNFDSSEAIAGDPDVTVNGNPATRTAKSPFTYEYTVLPTDPLGLATIEISGVDNAGNAGMLNNTTALTIVELEPVVPVAAWPAALLLAAIGSVFLARRRE